MGGNSEWKEDSLERVSYDVRADNVDAKDLFATIVQAIARLPNDIREFALSSCTFVSTGESNSGITVPGRVVDDWLIVLDERTPDESIVADEIAHAWLGHDRTSPDIPTDCEEQAIKLTVRWGFTGKGTNRPTD